jgi:hypothetical protein
MLINHFIVNHQGKIIKTFLLVALLFVLPVKVQAGSTFSVPGNKLVDRMHEDEKMVANDPNAIPYASGYYLGFVAAAADAFDLAGGICIEKGVTTGQIASIVTKYLKANPEKWNSPAINLVESALS